MEGVTFSQNEKFICGTKFTLADKEQRESHYIGHLLKRWEIAKIFCYPVFSGKKVPCTKSLLKCRNIKILKMVIVTKSCYDEKKILNEKGKQKPFLDKYSLW